MGTVFVKKQTKKPKPFLTGDTTIRPSPEYVDWTLSSLYKAKTIRDCLALLKDLLPDLMTYGEWLHPSDVELIEMSIRGWLVELRAKSSAEIPPVPFPFDVLSLLDWTTTAEKALKRKRKNPKISAEVKLMGALTMAVKNNPTDLPTIAQIARDVGVRRETAHRSPAFMSIYETLKPEKTTKMGSKFNYDGSRLSDTQGKKL